MSSRAFCLLVCCCVAFASCTHEKVKAPEPAATKSNYPTAVANIIETRCAISGCHNAASAKNSGGLLLDSWEHLFEGGSTGADIVPFSADNSSLLYFINTYPDLGITNLPTMPYQLVYNAQPVLSREEYEMMRSWVLAGAPDINGNIPFAANAPTRQKIYVTMQGCDLLAVIDAEKKVVMRYISIGKTPAIENPHCVRVSHDGNYAYVSFLGGQYVQKIDTRTDSIVAEVNVGAGSWNVLLVSPDDQQLMVSDWQPNGRMVLINAATMQVTTQFQGNNLFVYPHGIASNADFSMFYVTAQYGNTVYKFSPDGFYKKVSIDGNPPVTIAEVRDPHEIMMAPDDSKYFLTCEYSNEVRVMDAVADTVIKVIPVGIKPQEMAISTTKPYFFVTCMEDNAADPNFKGSVYVINYNTYETTRIDGPFYQPHGIAVDDKNGTFYVISRNANQNGPAPHHSSSCAGRNGYYNVYDLNTMQRLPKRYEVTVEPYSADVRFK